jgi:hypothetical protein
MVGGEKDETAKKPKPRRRAATFKVSFTTGSGMALERLAHSQGMFAPQYIRELCEAHLLSKRQTLAEVDGDRFEDSLRSELIQLNSELMRIAGIREDKQRALSREVRKRIDGRVESEVYADKDGQAWAVEGWEDEPEEEDAEVAKAASQKGDDAEEFDWSIPIQG